METKPVSSRFLDGLVFGFDAGTGSIGWACRKGTTFLEVGVLICPEDIAKLDTRRTLRRQRRTLRSKKYRRVWFAKELAQTLGLDLVRRGENQLPLPATAWEQNPLGGWVPKAGFERLREPVLLRVAALEGDELCAEEIFAALCHLFRRRGYAAVPWARGDQSPEGSGSDDDEGVIRHAVAEIESALGSRHPCQLLAERRTEAGSSPREKWGRKIYWPRERLEGEFRAIVSAQAARFPDLARKVDWLLHGDTRKVDGHHVFFKSTEGRNPGALGLRWPRFENRAPALDALNPFDELDRPLHVVRKGKRAFVMAQWELAVMNFRVIDRATGTLTVPEPDALARLREMWESSRRKRRKDTVAPRDHDNLTGRVEVRLALLQKWEREFSARYRLVEGQEPLTPQTGAGRARYASPTLDAIREKIEGGIRFAPPQPVLRREGESTAEALNRYLAAIRHPLVRHRLTLFARLLHRLTHRFGQPDLIVLEAVRSLALSERNRRELQKRIKQNRDERSAVREELASRSASTSRSAILRYRLWKEAGSTCPFCCKKITQEELLNGEADIEHLVPRSVVDCNEAFNLTIGHVVCNRELKRDRTPFEAFGHAPEWPQLRDNAERCFKGRKLEIFLSENAESLIEQKADLQHTAYIARVIRHVALIQLGWTGVDGRDPTIVKGNTPSAAFQVTNGQITSRLRKSWGLNQILHPLPEGRRWSDLTEEEQAKMSEKNRGDLRHHAVDAMVVACTLPWLAHRTVGASDPETGEHGWWKLDERTRRSLATNPIFPADGEMRRIIASEIDRVVVRHHVSQSAHSIAYATTIYGRRGKDTYIARKVFTTLTPKNLHDIWPPELAAYCLAAWGLYKEEAADVAQEMKRTRGCVPASFTGKLCFSHYQRWKASGGAEFSWPTHVRIPIRSVRLVSVKDDAAVVRCAPGTPGYVKRTEFKEVRIHLSEDGTTFVPVFVPYWRADPPIGFGPYSPGKPVTAIRKGQVVRLARALNSGAPAGLYRVMEIGRKQVKILPPHIANSDEAKVAFGLPASGYQPYWPEFIRCLGYELPHPAPAEPPAERSD